MGWLAGAAGGLFGLALALLAAFFVTKNKSFDRLAEWSFVAFAVLAIPTMLTVSDRLANGGVVTQVATLVGIAGVAVVGLGELGSTLRLIDFQRVAPGGTPGVFG